MAIEAVDDLGVQRIGDTVVELDVTVFCLAGRFGAVMSDAALGLGLLM